MKNLVIVESPAKAKTIHKFLGNNYVVKACMGHIRDLPKTRLGIDVENDFAPKYTIVAEKSALVKELRDNANKAQLVYLATDLDREGEAIAWHLCQALKLPEEKVVRVIFHEITGNALKTAFANPGKIQMGKVYAQQARRTLDRLVGYQLSPLLWEKIARGLSAGRVQSVAVKLIVEREKEITAFKSEEYWKITAKLSSPNCGGKIFAAELKKIAGKKTVIAEEQKAKEIVERLTGKEFAIDGVVRKEKAEKPPPPFTTSHLQQQASIQLRFRTQHTMAIAQQLYEGLDVGLAGPVGLITYMRTDSVHVSQEALEECRKFIGENFAAEYLPQSPNYYRNKKTAQGAHEAVRPTSVYRDPQSLKNSLSSDQYRLYKLVWDRFVASQMAAARAALTTVSIRADDCLFEAKGKEILFPGYAVLQGQEKTDEEEQSLPPLADGEKLDVREILPSQHFTQPPPRYTEATLVKTLEAKGIGRPSTYAPIITTIQDRGYVRLHDRKFWGTDLGIKVTDQLSNYFTGIMNYNFTADMETQLDQIELNEIDCLSVLKPFYGVFSNELKTAYEKMANIKKNPEAAGYNCDQCGAPLIFRYNKQGKFLGCSSFPNCKNTVPLDQNGNPVFPVMTEYPCEKCSRPMVLRQGKAGKFLGCSHFPECNYTLPVGMDGKPIPPEKTDTQCPDCGSPMVKKKGPRGFFLACSRYPDCKKALPLSPEKNDLTRLVRAVCELCRRPMTIRRGRGGVFFGCTGYPECKNIKRFSAELLCLPPQFQDVKCEKCGQSMVLRSGRKGTFWGCSQYPKCDGTKPCDLDEIASQIKDENPVKKP